MNEKKILTSNEDAVRLTTRDDIDWDVVAAESRDWVHLLALAKSLT